MALAGYAGHSGAIRWRRFTGRRLCQAFNQRWQIDIATAAAPYKWRSMITKPSVRPNDRREPIMIRRRSTVWWVNDTLLLPDHHAGELAR